MNEIVVETHEGIFRKKDNSLRKMNFVKLKDLPKQFVESKLSGGRKNNLPPGQELVWDLDEQEFRIFNWQTILVEVKTETKKIVL
jgi:hypothetical protein